MFHANTRAKMRFVILLFALLTLFLAGCSADGAAFIFLLTAVESPLPVPDEWSAAVDDDLPFDVPRPGADTGVLVGRIFSTSLNEYLPEFPVYLGEILPLLPGDDYLITLKEKESPQTMSTADGYVLFEDVPPGEYVLIVWLPMTSKVVPNPTDANKELRVTVVAGEVVNFGQAEVEFP